MRTETTLRLILSSERVAGSGVRTYANSKGKLSSTDHLDGLVVRVSPSRAEDHGIFSGSSRTSDKKIGTPVATLPGAWHYVVGAGTGRPGVSILRLGEVESLICNFCNIT